jgi:hypothetical protein
VGRLRYAFRAKNRKTRAAPLYPNHDRPDDSEGLRCVLRLSALLNAAEKKKDTLRHFYGRNYRSRIRQPRRPCLGEPRPCPSRVARKPCDGRRGRDHGSCNRLRPGLVGRDTSSRFEDAPGLPGRWIIMVRSPGADVCLTGVAQHQSGIAPSSSSPRRGISRHAPERETSSLITSSARPIKSPVGSRQRYCFQNEPCAISANVRTRRGKRF